MADIPPIQVTPEFEDFYRLVQFASSRQFLARIMKWAAALCLLVSLLAPLFPPMFAKGLTLWERYWAMHFGFLFAFLILVCWPLSVSVTARKRWSKVPETHEPRTYEFSDTGFTVRAESFSGSISWDNITQAEVAGKLLLLWTRQRQAYFIPIRALANRAEALKSLLRQHVPDCKRL